MIKRFVLAILAISVTTGCALSVQGQGSLFKKDAKQQARAAQDAVATATLLLKSGATDDAVEEVLRKGGLTADEAARTVAVAKAQISSTKTVPAVQ